ncbi:hypothetical protein SI65_01361 [Aspergillus cristatus]|uniref:Uncharacterized protein n=1 Tax=Aspergillus cristatus TaxID=573508 RepID=A0A1E3BS32_ASPCR|nr:hypothetical protein SI65_01361 [Aspergillus cristatus]
MHAEYTDDDIVACALPTRLHTRYVEYAYGWTAPAPFSHSEFSTIGKLCEVPHG